MAHIGIFDSGCGGLSVLRELHRLAPGEKYSYFSDNANCPYGDKSDEFIIARSKEITSSLLNKGADIIVVACNTATAAAIATLRRLWPGIPFVGMEPAIKPAVQQSRSKVVGVLATSSTLKADKYLNNKKLLDSNVRIVEHVGEAFVELVENFDLSGAHCEQIVRRSLEPLLVAGADVIVLGCTHYPFLLKTMQSIAGPQISFIDPAPAVARQMLHIMAEKNLPLSPAEEGKISLECSGSDQTARKLLELALNLA